jgi:DNA-binding NtrC family response regulator
MPVLNRLQLAESIKARGYGVPVILMTSYGSEEIAVQALRAGAASYVPKLALEKNLIATIKSVLFVSSRQVNRRRLLSTLDSAESRFVLENDTSLIAPLIDYLQE